MGSKDQRIDSGVESNSLPRLISSYYSTWQHNLVYYHRKLINLILDYPFSSILWPIVFIFIIAYPSLYSFFNDASSNNAVNYIPNNIKSIKIDMLNPNEVSASQPVLQFKHIWIQSNVTTYTKDTHHSSHQYTKKTDVIQSDLVDEYNYKTLTKSFLVDLLNLQDMLLENIELFSIDEYQGTGVSKNLAFLHSPLEFWDSNRTCLINDENVLKTIQLKESYPSDAGLPLNHLGLFSGLKKVDGLITSCKAIQISMFYVSNGKDITNKNENINYCDAGCQWDKNLESIKSNRKFDQFLIFDQDLDDYDYNYNYIINNFWSLKIKHYHFFESFFLNISLFILIIYILISLTNIHSVRSRTGLLLAYVIEISFSIFASISVSSYFFNSSITFQNPLKFLLFPLFLISLENTFRLLTTISKNSNDDISLRHKIIKSVITSSTLSSTIIILNIILITGFYLFYSNNQGKQFCFFSIMALIIDHFLHITYFTAILAVDIRRLELEDLLQLSLSSNSNTSSSSSSSYMSESSNTLLSSTFASGFINFISFIASSLSLSSSSISSSNGSKQAAEFPTIIKPLTGGGAFLSSTLLNGFSFNHNYNDSLEFQNQKRQMSYKRIIGQFLLKIKMPLCLSLQSSFIMSFFALIFAFRWADCILYDSHSGSPLPTSPASSTVTLDEYKYSMKSSIFMDAISPDSRYYNSHIEDNSEGKVQYASVENYEVSVTDYPIDQIYFEQKIFSAMMLNILKNINDNDDDNSHRENMDFKKLKRNSNKVNKKNMRKSKLSLMSKNKSKNKGNLNGKKGQPYEEIIVHFNEPTVLLPKSSILSTSKFTNNKLMYNNRNTKNLLSFNPISIYKFDLFYILEFFSFLLFVLSSTSIILKLAIDKDQLNLSASSNLRNSNGVNDDSLLKDVNDVDGDGYSNNLHSKDLVKGHYLDIVKGCTSSCPFIVSVGMDHKVLVWSPLSNPLPPPAQLPISGKLLPITNVVMSSSGSLIAVFSKSGIVKCWSRFTMSWIFTVQIDVLKSKAPLEAFFRKRTNNMPARRKLVPNSSASASSSSKKRLVTRDPGSKSSKSSSTTSSSENGDSVSDTTSNSNTKNVINDKKLKSRIKLNADAKVIEKAIANGFFDTDSAQNLKITQLQLMKDFVIILPTGELVEINCANGQVDRSFITHQPIAAIKKISSPRVNDRIVSINEDGSMVVATVVNNKWKPRTIKIQKETYNSGQSLITPAAISRASSMNMKSVQQFQQFKMQQRSGGLMSTGMMANSMSPMNSLNSMGAMSNDSAIDTLGNSPKDATPINVPVSYQGCVMETVPFVGMIVRAKDLKAELIDVQTGILLKEFTIGQFKDSTFKVFHPEPSHCRFCGCASISSFSIAYTELESNTLILHTFANDNRAKSNICLRVERDPRETRCLGFASVTETQHWLTHVEGWCATDLNMIMGIRRKENGNEDDDFYDDDNELIGSSQEDTSTGTSRNSTEVRNRSLGNGDRKKDNSQSSHGSNSAGSNPKLSDIWESFTMSSSGQVKYYNIPDGSDSGLLIKKLGPIMKFGHKSIIVSFGNIMKVLFLGNDKLIDEGEEQGTTTEGQTLSFINRRRKMRLKKYELTHSTNFNDMLNIDDDHISEEE